MKNSLLTLFATTGLLFGAVALPEAVLAQRVIDVSPAINSQNVAPDSSISGQFDPGTGAPVDANSVRIFVNGQDVTNRSTITRNFFSYRPAQPFSPGNVRVQVQYRNTSGEQRSVEWNFTVQPPQAAVQITSVTHNAVTPLGAGANFLATINGTPGSQASVLLVQDGRSVREVSAQEVSSGVYVATVTVQRNERISEGVVVGRLRRQGQTAYAAASQPFAFNSTSGSVEVPQTGTGSTPPGTGTGTGTGSTAQLQPRFTSHRNGDSVSGGFSLIGQTQPNATVRVNVTSRVAVLGVSLGSQTLVDQDVTADRNGQFRIAVPAPNIPVPGTRYTVRATARSGNTTSPATEIILRQQ